MSRGYIYVLSNPSMPGIYKVGKTTRCPDQRALELFQTGVPEPFKVEIAVETPNCDELEVLIHNDLARLRVSTSREFFRGDKNRIIFSVENFHREQVESWLNEFMPDHTIVYGYEHVDISSVAAEAHNVGIAYPDVSRVLELMTEAELRPAYERLKRIKASWQEETRSEASNEPQSDQLGV